MRRLNNELRCCDKQSTAVAYFEAGLLSLLVSFCAWGFTRLTVKFSEIEEPIQGKVIIGITDQT
ncbi:hypothetical protein T11_3978 [Trichinella zimbabwensis]|uniref:Uncharacterized protein n=1 Tax=Trichinella zimbabwensis TaxID=268475 RepID=A0A0V1HS31_9BILA|nr:hypothetical protein T11_3978 [Trichinella zimbabwensis]